MSLEKNKQDVKDNEEIDLGRLIGEIIDHRKIIISITALFTLIGIVYALFSTPIYQANALIQVEQKQANAILSNLSQMLPDSQPQSATEIALLQSRMILGKTVDDLNLQANAKEKFFPVLGRGWARLTNKNNNTLKISRLYISGATDEDDAEVNLRVISNNSFVVSGDDFEVKGEVGKLLDTKDLSLKIDSINAPEGTEFILTYATRLKVITDLQKVFSVSDQGKDTGILTLSLLGSNPELIKEIINSISKNYLDQNISRQAAQDAKSLEFLDAELPKVRSELDIAEDKLNAYRKKSDSVDLSLEAKSVLDQIVNVDNQLNELTFRESEISQLYTKEHPTYKALLEKRKTLQDERSKLNKRVSAMPETQQEVLRLSRDVESGRAVYMQLLNRQQELNISKSSAIGNVRIIDDAITEPQPVKPNKILVSILSFILGIILSIGYVLLKTFLRRGIESPEQLEEIGINVYASVPLSETFSKNVTKNIGWKKTKNVENYGFLAVENPADLAIEAIRGLRTSLHFAMMEARNNVLMISGASPNSGKSFISSNLAAVISQSGKKVLLIDTDLRKGYLHRVFNVNNTAGLSDYLSGKLDVKNIILKSKVIDFDFISRGTTPPNPAELLMHQRFQDLVSWANENLYSLIFYGYINH